MSAGGVIYTQLWNLLMDDLLVKIRKVELQAVSYATDLMIIARSQFLEPLTVVMQEALKLQVEEWWCQFRQGRDHVPTLNGKTRTCI